MNGLLMLAFLLFQKVHSLAFHKKTENEQTQVKELVLCLNQCALPQLAKLCDENTIDGEFLFDLQEHDLRDKPYSLSKIEMLKAKKMKEGWRPKFD
jgi:hypothetical protein